MREAFEEAEKAFDRGESPVGAVLVIDGAIVARAGNQELELHDPTAHAEILVLRQAGVVLSQHTFPESVIYTTLWPCPMCENALLRANVPRVVCGARSFKFIYTERFASSNLLKVGPVMEEECRAIFLRWAADTGRDFLLTSEAWAP